MNKLFTLQLAASLFMALVVFFFIHCGDRKRRFIPENMNPQYAQFPYILYFPGYLCFFYLSTDLGTGGNHAAANLIMFSACFILFLHLTVYYGLLLETAGNERGFTSCLAASTSALRYRLENIITPRSRKSGAFLSAFITFCMLMSVGAASLSIQ